MQPYLFLGVGGSGGKVLRYLWRELDRQVRVRGWDDPELPACFQFLHIDLPDQYDGGAEADIPVVRELDSGRYVGLGNRDVPYRNYDLRACEGTRIEGLMRWRPADPRRIPSPGRGAGQRRAVGRVTSVLRHEEISAAVTSAMNALVEGKSHQDLLRLRSLLPDGAAFAGTGHVVIVGSLAGGSGSGIFLDVVEAVRHTTTAFSGNLDPQTVLLAPDIFASLGPSAGIYPNALAALAELVNAAESTGIVPAAEQELRAGPLAHVAGPRLGRSNFVVGASNGEVTFGSIREVYEAVGRLLGALALNPRHQQPFDQYLDVNAETTHVGRHLGRAASCSSVGYAVVGLGRHLFQRYGAECLARHVFDRLVAGHEERDADLPSDVRLARMVDSRWSGGFLEATGLNELGPDANQVIDALRDRELVTSRVQSLKNEVLEAIRARPNRFTGDDWLVAHDGQFKAAALKLEAGETAERHRRAKLWTDTIQSQLVEAVVAEIACYGLPVALGLLDRLDHSLDDTVASLRKEVADHQDKEVAYTTSARSLLRGITDELRGSAEEHDRSAQFRGSALVMRFEAETAVLAAELLADIRANLLPPLRRALRGGLNRLREEAAREPTRSILARWSTGSVPPHLRPAANEVLVKPAAAFPDELAGLLARQFPGTQPRDALKRAVEEIISGAWPAYTAMAAAQTLITSQASWEPLAGAARWADAAASTAELDVSLGIADLPRRAEAWMTGREGPIRDHLRQTLAQFLADEEAAGTNTSAFLAAFSLALARSRPFVFVDPDVALTLHGSSGQATFSSVSVIPVAEAPGTPLYDGIARALAAEGIDLRRVEFDTSSQVAEVDVIRYPQMRFHPAALRSVTGPIAEDWGNRRNHEQTRAEFWDCRRSRTLEAYVPLPREQQLDLTAGYFLAASLGYINLPYNELWSARARHVWSPAGLLGLPRHLLVIQGREPRSAREVLPALFESFPLCWLGITSEQSPLPAYERLMDLGATPDGRCHPELAHWIAHGSPPDGLTPLPGVPVADLEADGTDTAQGRHTALIAHLELITATLHQRAELPLSADTAPRDVDGLREITGLVATALARTIDSLAAPGEQVGNELV